MSGESEAARLQIPDHTLMRRIGQGSYGDVWLARNVMGTFRAVKVVYRKGFESDRPYEREFGGIKRFEPISRSHEGFVDILQVGRNDQAGYFYYVMELADDAGARVEFPQAKVRPPGSSGFADSVAGAAQAGRPPLDAATYVPCTLQHEIQRRSRVPIEECLQLALSLTSALRQLHKQGLVHRDVKPSNIIFVDGLPKLADIGLVASLTEARSFVGTMGFIPPEGPGTPQADLYSLGKVLYEMSTGKDRNDFPELPSDARESPERDQLIELNEILLKACQNDPAKRYPSAEEMRADLALLHGGRSVKHLRIVERRLALLTRVGLVAGAATALAIGGYLFETKRRIQAEQSREQTEALLWNSYLAQARANRWSGRPGRRFESLETLARAAAIRPSLELRNEAIACLALADLRVTKEWKGFPPPATNFPGTSYVALDEPLERYARCELNGAVTIRRVADDAELLALPIVTAGAGYARFSPDGRFLAIRQGTHGKLFFRLWDLGLRQAILETPALGSDSFVAFTDDSQWVAFVRETNAVDIAEAGSGKTWKRIVTRGKPGHLRFSADGRHLAVALGSLVGIYHLESGHPVASLSHPGGVFATAWRSDGKLLATACGDFKVYLWDVSTLSLTRPDSKGSESARVKVPAPRVLEGHTAEAVSVTFAHHGDLLASASWDGTTRLWDSNAGRPLLTEQGTHPYFSADDKRLAYELRPTIGIWELATGRECRTALGLLGGRAPVAGFSPDGRLLATANDPGVQLWDLASDAKIATLPWEGSRSAWFAPEGQGFMVSGTFGLRLVPITSRLTNGGAELQLGPWRQISPAAVGGRAANTADGRFVAMVNASGGFVLDRSNPSSIVAMRGHSGAHH
ncbi:MAG TPA: serine/threonine-protein kinase, partial [Candidatus Saccharimonadales bacterium]|nr:serine/threonine-protein kinase [Candidatus Saccharimonadales bacterium]